MDARDWVVYVFVHIFICVYVYVNLFCVLLDSGESIAIACCLVEFVCNYAHVYIYIYIYILHIWN